MRSASLTLLLWTLVTTPLLAACGTGAGGVCNHLVDCDYIDEDDFDACKADISTAVKDGNPERDEVQECKRCSYENGFGVELFGCITERTVWAEIDGSGF